MKAAIVAGLMMAAVCGSARAADDDFAKAAGLCEALFEGHVARDAAGESRLFSDAGFADAGVTLSQGEVSRSYTRSGRPLDGVMIVVNRTAEAADTNCSVMLVGSVESGQALISARKTQADWRADGTDHDDTAGEGQVFRRGPAERHLFNIIWGDPKAAMPISVASYQIDGAN